MSKRLVLIRFPLLPLWKLFPSTNRNRLFLTFLTKRNHYQEREREREREREEQCQFGSNDFFWNVNERKQISEDKKVEILIIFLFLLCFVYFLSVCLSHLRSSIFIFYCNVTLSICVFLSFRCIVIIATKVQAKYVYYKDFIHSQFSIRSSCSLRLVSQIWHYPSTGLWLKGNQGR